MLVRKTPSNEFIAALIGATFAALVLYGWGVYRNHSFYYGYLTWNLFLAWLPLLFATWLMRLLRTKLWSDWIPLGVSILWVLFLPNSFYLISDFIHLNNVPTVDVLFDTVMFSAFIYTGVLIGITSVYLVHRELRKRLTAVTSAVLIAGTLLVSSFAIYIGRDLRWNSWDVVTNPGGLLFDISDRILHPSAYHQMFVTTISFFILLGSMYVLAYNGVKALQKLR
ncbi:MAG TPA: DUF1361 domain-containing protein [Candidatus Saccharimonadales bacterium]|nr:DUF1361 domain-containing protein [Candidatus Saccharimonadales bacterium]